jgi:hypothetical protein
MAITLDIGMVHIRSRHSADRTIERLRGLLESKDVMLFVLVDHSGEAEKVGLVPTP